MLQDGTFLINKNNSFVTSTGRPFATKFDVFLCLWQALVTRIEIVDFTGDFARR
jgi:hypothetical protein